MITLREALMDYKKAKNVPANHKKALSTAVASTKLLWEGLGLHTPRTVFVTSKSDKSAVARYISGTFDNPVFIFYATNIERVSREDNWSQKELETGYKGNLVHEIIHAYLETVGVDTIDHNEETVERLTRDWLDGLATEYEIKMMCDEIANKHYRD